VPLAGSQFICEMLSSNTLCSSVEGLG